MMSQCRYANLRGQRAGLTSHGYGVTGLQAARLRPNRRLPDLGRVYAVTIGK